MSGSATPKPAELSASNVFFHPLPPAHAPAPGKEIHGRYMLTVPWSRVSGWGQAKISPRADLSFDPLAGVLQYAVTCFEGMKCFKNAAGELTLFRPKKNSERLRSSAARIGLPCDWDDEVFVSLLSKLLSLEEPLVPTEDGANLYIRPTLLETSEGFGIKEDAYAGEALLYIVTTLNLGKKMYPSAESQENGIRLDACKEYIRAWPGGTGCYKLGANYGTVNIAKKPGFAMSLWLHGQEDFISEAGAMNVFIIKEAEDGFLEFVTMSLENGIVLPGITRDSIITMLTEHAEGKAEYPLPGMPKKIRVVQRDFSMPEVVQGIKDGSLKGMFGCGTGVVTVSIREVQYEGQLHQIPYNPLVLLIRDTLTSLQKGKVERGGWCYKIPKWKGVQGEKQAEGQEAYA